MHRNKCSYNRKEVINVAVKLYTWNMILIINPNLNEVVREDLIKEWTRLLNKNSSRAVKPIEWGMKKLAYPIGEHKQGYYVYFEGFTATELQAEAYERMLDGHEVQIIKHLLVRDKAIGSTVEVELKNPDHKSERPDAMDVLLGLAKYE